MMDHRDKAAIQGLFEKLSQARHAQPDRDPEAEALIAELMTRNPGAAYYLAQTVIMQEQALNAAQERMDQTQPRAGTHQGGGQQGGGLLGRLFGTPPARQPVPSPRMQASPPQAAAPAGPWNSGRPGGGGFMAGAAQTAMGVAGGVLLGNAIGGMFAGPAEAGQMEQEPAMDDQMAADEAAYDDPGLDDGGFEE